jgi:hypothetical protein
MMVTYYMKKPRKQMTKCRFMNLLHQLDGSAESKIVIPQYIKRLLEKVLPSSTVTQGTHILGDYLSYLMDVCHTIYTTETRMGRLYSCLMDRMLILKGQSCHWGGVPKREKQCFCVAVVIAVIGDVHHWWKIKS